MPKKGYKRSEKEKENMSIIIKKTYQNGRIHNTPKWLARIKEVHTGNKYASGYKHTPEEIEKIKVASLTNGTAFKKGNQLFKGRIPWNKNQKTNPETINKMKKSITIALNKPEVRKKLREARARQVTTPESRLKRSRTLKLKYKSGELVSPFKEIRKHQVFPLKDTTIEIKIQQFLEQLQIDYFKHKYIKEIEHGYQCDIFIPAMNLVIECDGDWWHKYPTGTDIDHIRTSELLAKGFKVLRLWEFEIKKMDVSDFKNKIDIIQNGKKV